MKKYLFIALAAVAMMFVGCEKDPVDNGGDDNAVSVVGTWYHHSEDFAQTLTLNQNGTFSNQTSMTQRVEGTYVYANDTLALTVTLAYEADVEYVDGQPVVSNWHEVPPYETYVATPARLIYSNDVLLIGQPDFDDGSLTWVPYVKENATHVSNVNDIQGKWYWMMKNAGFPRLIVNVQGDQGDVIITPWGERYVGTIRYEKGIIYMDNPTFYTTRYGQTGGSSSEHMNFEDPENSPWLTPDGSMNFDTPTWISLDLLFVVEGDVAYGNLANLLATFERQ